MITEKEELEKMFKKASKPADAMPLIKFMMESKGKINEEERKGFMDAIMEGARKGGEILLKRLEFEGIMSQREIEYFLFKHDLAANDMDSVLMGYFNKRDGTFPKDEEVIIVTMSNNKIYEHRKVIEKTFEGITILSCEEATKRMMEKEAVEKLTRNKKQR